MRVSLALVNTLLLASLLASPNSAAGTVDESTLAPATIQGFVTMPDGTLAVDAIITTSAGGQTRADLTGGFALTLELPLEAKSLTLFAHIEDEHGHTTHEVSQVVQPELLGTARIGGIALAKASACSPRWQAVFGETPGVSDDVLAITSVDTGAGPIVFVGGNFGRAGKHAIPYIAQWRDNRWMRVGRGLNGPAQAFAVFDDGHGPALYVSGSFTHAGSALAANIAKWNGRRWSPLGLGLSSPASAMTVFDDGSGPALFATGGFATAGGAPANGVAKWNGTSWSALGSGLAGGSGRSLTVFDDGTGPALFVGGEFDLAGGGAASKIAKWNGASWSNLGAGIDGSATPSLPVSVNALEVYDDGNGARLYAGGRFSSADGVATIGIARWDGASFTAVGGGSDNNLHAMKVFDGGNGPELYVGGNFGFPIKLPSPHIARWNGSTWSDVGEEPDAPVNALGLFSDGASTSLLIGGTFRSAGDFLANRVARWDGSDWSTFGEGMNGTVETFVVHDDGSGPALFVSGLFESAGSVPASRIARHDGSAWSALSTGFGLSIFSDYARALEVFDDGSGPALYAGGGFTEAGGMPNTANIARWDGANWSAVGVPGLSAGVRALLCFDDGGGRALYAGGFFTQAGGMSAKAIAKWDGSAWSPLGSSLSGSSVSIQPPLVQSMVEFDDGSGPALYVAGDFLAAGSIAGTKHIARWDGTSWASVGGGFESPIFTLEVFDDGSGPALYVGGNFTLAGSTSVSSIAKWDGSAWTSVNAGVNGVVLALEVFNDGSGPDLYVGGVFSLAGGSVIHNIARWNGATWSPLGRGLPPAIHSLTVFDDGNGPDLYIGGSFTNSPVNDGYITKWGCPPPPLIQSLPE